MTDSWTVPAPTTSATGAALPGGTGDIAALVAAGDLVGDGLIDLRGQGIPKDGGLANPAATANLCGYLFGAPGQVAETARLTGDITLDPISGRHASGSAVGSTSALTTEPGTGTGTTASTGTGTAEATDTRTMATPASAAAPVLIACVYRSDGAPVLVLQIGNGPPIDPDLPGKPIIVDGTGGLQAVLSYSPQHQGATIAPATARDWLSAAIGRVAPI